MIDFPLKNYDENGNEVESATSTSFLSGNTGEISYSSDGTPIRGMTCFIINCTKTAID